MPKAILHVGTMKTGTTSIQSMLNNNRDELSTQNYTYCSRPLRQSHDLAKVLQNLLEPERNLIISDEGLWHFADSKRSDTAAFAKELSGGYDVTVIIYLRRPDSFLNSWFLQGLKSGTGARTFTEFLASRFVASGLMFTDKIKRFENLFGAGSIRLRPYEKEQMEQGDAVRDFLNTVGLSADTLKMSAPTNTSPDTDGLLLRSLFQAKHSRSPELLGHLEYLRAHLSQQGYKGRRYNLLSQVEMSELTARFKPEFEALQATYGGGANPAFFTSWPDPEEVDDGQLTLRRAQEALLKSTSRSIRAWQDLITRFSWNPKTSGSSSTASE